MNLPDCPKFEDTVREIKILAKRAFEILPSERISTWDKTNWSIALTIAIVGISLTQISGGLSLIASLLGILWLLIDVWKKIRETSTNEKRREEAADNIERIEFLVRCLKNV